jgi:hypothetical protein
MIEKQPAQAPGLCDQSSQKATDPGPVVGSSPTKNPWKQPAAATDPAATTTQQAKQPAQDPAAPDQPAAKIPANDPAPAKQTRQRRGRPTKYKPKYCKMLVEYFDQRPFYTEREIVYTAKNGQTWSKYELTPAPLRFISSFADSIGTTKQTIHAWKDIYPEFLDAYARAKELYKEHLAVCGSMGLFNANFTQFLAKNTTDWTDRREIEHGGHVETTMFFENMLNKAQEARQWSRAGSVN